VKRLWSAVPWVLLAAALGVGGWIGWDAWQSAREANREAAAAPTTTMAPPATTTTAPPTTVPPITSTTTSTTTTTAPPATTTTSALPEGWEDSCDLVVASLIDQGYAVMGEIGTLTAAADNARAGAGTWDTVAEIAGAWVIPRVETLLASVDQVLLADPGVVATIAAEAFRSTALPLRAQAERLLNSVLPPGMGAPDQAAWDDWWRTWSNSVQDLNDVLSRAPQMAYNCPD